MGALGEMRGRARAASRGREGSARLVDAGEAAWLSLLPLSLLAVLAIAWLGPPVGTLLLRPPTVQFWAVYRAQAKPEPVEQGRYLVAILVALLFLGAVVLLTRLRVRLPARVSRAAVLLAQAASIGFLAFCLYEQKEEYLFVPGQINALSIHYFTRGTLLVAAAGAAVAIAMLQSNRWCARVASHATAANRRSRLFAVVAAAFTALWLSHAVYTETTIGTAYREVWFHLPFTMDETFAVLDGRSPLVNFAAQYGSIWPYAFAAVMSLTRATVGVWVAMCVIASGLGMLSIYGVLRRVARSPLYGLVLFLPVLATSFFLIGGSLENRYTIGNYYATFPIRYAGPSFLAYLVVRHLDGARPRRLWPLFLAAGVVAINNADTGIGALGATFAAALWTTRSFALADLRRLALQAGRGLLLAFAAVSLLTLVRAGSLPDLGMLMRFSRLFALAGFGMHPMRPLGLHIVLYATFVAALAVATVRRLLGDPDRALTGMLAWSGVFGLGAGAYFVGRSTADDLIAVFFPWAFALALLTIPSVRSLRSASLRSWPVAAAACVFGFFVVGCSLAQTPTPWSQVARLEHTAPAVFREPPGQRFVAEHSRPGEKVLIFMLLGHRIAANVQLTDVLPYAAGLSMPTVEQWLEAIDDLKAAGGHKLFVARSDTSDEMQIVLTRAGFAFVTEDARGQFSLWSDG